MKSILFIFLVLFNLSLYADDWNEVLFVSSENGDLAKVKQSLDKGAKINYQSQDSS